MSKNFNKVKDFVTKRLWTELMVRNAVGKWITAEEYEDITGAAYND